MEKWSELLPSSSTVNQELMFWISFLLANKINIIMLNMFFLGGGTTMEPEDRCHPVWKENVQQMRGKRSEIQSMHGVNSTESGKKKDGTFYY